MSSPGGGAEAVSWIDVAASAAGLTEQFRSIGTAAVGEFSRSFAAGSPQITQAVGRMGREAGAAWAAEAKAAMGAAALTQPITTALGTQLSSQLGQVGRRTGQEYAEHLGSGIAESTTQLPQKILSTILPSFSRLAPLFEQHGRSHGQMYTTALAQETEKLGGQLIPTMDAVGANVAAQAAKAGELSGAAMKAGLVGAALVGAELVKKAFGDLLHYLNGEAEAFGKVGEDAAGTLMGSFTDVLNGRLPDVMGAMHVLSEGMQTVFEAPINYATMAVDSTLGRIPIIGSVFSGAMGEVQSAVGGVFDVFNEFTGLAGEFSEQMLDIGDAWQETARRIAGQTLDDGQLQSYLGILRDMSASGKLANFGDAAENVGLLGQRLSSLGGGIGLSNDQLRELTTTLAEGDELLGGVKIDVNNLTAAFNDFGTAPAEAAEQLNFLINVARMTGTNINTVITSVDQLGPVLQSMGYNLDQVAFFAARMGQELGPVAAGRMAGSFVKIDENLKKSGGSWQPLIDVVKDYTKAGDEAGARDFLKDMGAPARNAANLVKLISDGILSTPEQLQQAIDASGSALHQPLDEVLEKTRTMQDAVSQLSNQMKAAFGQIGVPLVEGLTHASDYLRTWLATHQSDLIGWAGKAMDTILHVVGIAAKDIGLTLIAAAPAIQEFTRFIIAEMQLAAQMMGSLLAPFTHLPKALGGDMARTMSHDLTDAIKGLDKLKMTDMVGGLDKLGVGLSQLGVDAEGARAGVHGYVDKAAEAAKINEAFQQSFAKKPGDKPELADAFESDKDGLKILGGPDTVGKVRDDLGKLGIHIDVDQATGEVRRFTADTKQQADALRDYLKEKFGPKTWDALAPKVKIDAAPPLTPDQSRTKLGLPPNVTVPVVPVPGGGQSGIPGAPPPNALPVPNPPNVIAPNTIGGVFGGSHYSIPTPSKVVIPAGFKITAPNSDLDGQTVLAKAGIPAKFRNDQDAATGHPDVMLPTGLDITDARDHKTVAEVMDAVGIPDSMQGSDGVTLPVGFGMSSGGGVPGLPGTPGGPGISSAPFTGGGAGGIRSIDWDGIAKYESSGDWTIDHGEGPQVSGGLQIAKATWASHGGLDYAPEAYLATKAQQIAVAQRIMDDPAQGPGAWPETFKHHPELFGGSGATPAAAAGGGGGSGSADAYAANPGADDLQGVTPEIAYVTQIAHQFGLRLTAGKSGHGTHDRDGGYHDSGQAGDFSNGMQTGAELAFSRYMEDHFGPMLAEVIHTDPNLTRLVKDGISVDPQAVYGPWLSGHKDHVHIAIRPGALGNIAGPSGAPMPDMSGGGPKVFTAGWQTSTDNGGGLTVMPVGKGDGGTPAPNTPGSNYASVPPPPGMQPAAPGAPGAVQTPYGSFNYTWDMPPEQSSLLTPEQRQKFDRWLQQQEHLTEQATTTQDDLDRLKAKKDEADAALAAKEAEINKLPEADRQKQRDMDPDYRTAKEKADTADRAYSDAGRRQHDQQTSARVDAESPPPWESSSKTEKTDANAETMGKGFLKGVFQELGFPDVFGKVITEWGIFKTAIAGLGAAFSIATAPGVPKAGGPLAPGGAFAGLRQAGQAAEAASGSTGTTTGSSSTGGALPAIAKGLGESLLPHGAAWKPPTAGQQPGGAPTPATALPAVQSETPANMSPAAVPAAMQGGGGTLTVNNSYAGFNPTPQVKDQIRQAANTTAAAQVHGGAGVPV